MIKESIIRTPNDLQNLLQDARKHELNKVLNDNLFKSIASGIKQDLKSKLADFSKKDVHTLAQGYIVVWRDASPKEKNLFSTSFFKEAMIKYLEDFTTIGYRVNINLVDGHKQVRVILSWATY